MNATAGDNRISYLQNIANWQIDSTTQNRLSVKHFMNLDITILSFEKRRTYFWKNIHVIIIKLALYLCLSGILRHLQILLMPRISSLWVLFGVFLRDKKQCG